MNNIEGVEEINPDHIHPGMEAWVLLKNPAVSQVEPDGSVTELVPSADSFKWSKVPLIGDVDNCEHVFSMCEECANSWAEDYWIKFTSPSGNLIWESTDIPTGLDES